MLTTKSHPTFQSPIDCQIDDITVDPNKLLQDLLESDRPLFAIAGAHKLSVPQLLVWCDQPAVRALLSDMDDLALRRASHKAAQARQVAIQVLTEQALSLCETSRDRDQANRAARAILRYRIDGADPEPAPPVSRRIADLHSQLPPRPSTPSKSQQHTSRKPTRTPHPALKSLRFPLYRFILRPESHNTSPPYQLIESNGPHQNGHNNNDHINDNEHFRMPAD